MMTMHKWAEFRKKYPKRPFCLLMPVPDIGKQNVSVPENFKSDDNVIYEYGIPRDNGDASKASDWVAKCRLHRYTSANVAWVGLFIDDSGSMAETSVPASRDLFYSKLEAKGIQVQKVVNMDENWIVPFMTNLVPD